MDGWTDSHIVMAYMVMAMDGWTDSRPAGRMDAWMHAC